MVTFFKRVEIFWRITTSIKPLYPSVRYGSYLTRRLARPEVLVSHPSVVQGLVDCHPQVRQTKVGPSVLSTQINSEYIHFRGKFFILLFLDRNMLQIKYSFCRGILCIRLNIHYVKKYHVSHKYSFCPRNIMLLIKYIHFALKYQVSD